MTTTSYAFTDPRAMTVWGTELFEEALANARLTPLMGNTKDSIIYMKEDLKTQQGGTIVLKIGNRLTGGGQGDDGNTTGNEQQLTKGNMSLEVHERCTSALSAGMASEQLTDIKGVDGFRQDAKEELSVLLEEWIENDIVTCVSGCYNENSGGSAIQTINESYPETARIWYGGQSIGATPALANSGVSYASDALLTVGAAASNRFGTLVIDKVRNLALASTPRFRPGIFRQPSASSERDVRFPLQGKKIGNMFVILVSPDQISTVKAEVGNNAWANMTAQAATRGNDHPVFTGATFLWNGCIIIEYDRILQRTGAATQTLLSEGFSLNAGRTETDDPCADGRTVHRGILLGAQAACFGWAQTPGWFEDYVDCNHLKVKMDMMYGVAKTKFNAHGTTTPGNEYSTYVFDTQQ